ncbi:hypothetical protein NEUTE1DRAFT_112657 [Neurospora tetrasperma FGSC 2508]|uniref:Uncharacterized protein n=1 Tax=Neurospora tetrasperma (strain FGSC 2508 / ATCC MYA-4615 / P0657) TaxID=510951 RepID=F8MWG8_NEUT8|nr:uncharacterized protein NEUTE1DRAFT_112657 [Neurospora tetrasperma FGSC 2508]EGO54110.1 hypothetical protein NEUTE1DRAFT_112657 [Neurospora tetrasperma FGSC 2508]EGZ68467.1 hypothetical protein NEUTE2DRAFT_142069 [Neurospora tetrasperma FGSC 2509]
MSDSHLPAQFSLRSSGNSKDQRIQRRRSVVRNRGDFRSRLSGGSFLLSRDTRCCSGDDGGWMMICGGRSEWEEIASVAATFKSFRAIGGIHHDTELIGTGWVLLPYYPCSDTIPELAHDKTDETFRGLAGETVIEIKRNRKYIEYALYGIFLSECCLKIRFKAHTGDPVYGDDGGYIGFPECGIKCTQVPVSVLVLTLCSV